MALNVTGHTIWGAGIINSSLDSHQPRVTIQKKSSSAREHGTGDAGEKILGGTEFPELNESGGGDN